MKNKQRKFAVKLYLRRIEEDPNYSENQFAAEVQQYMNKNFSSNPLYNAYDPFSPSHAVPPCGPHASIL